MIKTVMLILISFTSLFASSICVDNGLWIENIGKNRVSITMSGNEPLWEGIIDENMIFSFNSLKKRKVIFSFSENNKIIFFETKDKTIFGQIVLSDNCINNEEGNYHTQLVVNNRLYIDEFTFVDYNYSKIHINKSLYAFCKSTGIKESEIRALNPWINKKATNIPPNAEIIIPNISKEENNESK